MNTALLVSLFYWCLDLDLYITLQGCASIMFSVWIKIILWHILVLVPRPTLFISVSRVSRVGLGTRTPIAHGLRCALQIGGSFSGMSNTARQTPLNGIW